MKKRTIWRSAAISCLVIALILPAACSPGAPSASPTPGASGATPASQATAGPPTAPTTAEAPTAAPTALPTTAEAPTAAPTAAPAGQATAEPSTAPPLTTTGPAAGTEPTYLDDRSNGEMLIRSYYNAINRKEYARAYSYWENPGGSPSGPPPFPQFRQGYAETASVQLTIGAIGSDVGAGQLYYTVPVSLTATTTAGPTQAFVGCYALHLGSPAAQGTPPFRPLSIESAQVEQVASGANMADMLAHACQERGLRLITPQPTTNPPAIDAQVYLDDRSDPAEVLRSLYNAINRKEYLRAYSYWLAPAGSPSGPPPFPQFQQGYSNTQSVQLTTGTVSGNAGVGQLNYAVPVTLRASMTDGTTQTFVGCYRLRQPEPSLQEMPPFVPLGIESAQIQQVANDANSAELMNQSCQ